MSKHLSASLLALLVIVGCTTNQDSLPCGSENIEWLYTALEAEGVSREEFDGCLSDGLAGVHNRESELGVYKSCVEHLMSEKSGDALVDKAHLYGLFERICKLE